MNVKQTVVGAYLRDAPFERTNKFRAESAKATSPGQRPGFSGREVGSRCKRKSILARMLVPFQGVVCTHPFTRGAAPGWEQDALSGRNLFLADCCRAWTLYLLCLLRYSRGAPRRFAPTTVTLANKRSPPHTGRVGRGFFCVIAQPRNIKFLLRKCTFFNQMRSF